MTDNDCEMNFFLSFLVNGPLIHHFYVYLEKILPKNQPNAQIKRVLFDRLVFAPPFLLIFLYYVAIVEVRDFSFLDKVSKQKSHFVSYLSCSLSLYGKQVVLFG